MVNVFVARQPILDRDQHTVGYELLFRDGLENSFPDLDGDTATFRLLSNTFFAMGIEDVMDNRPVFINFPQALIEKKIPLFFPNSKMVIEILEDVAPAPDVLAAVKKFRKKGFHIALDDFVFREDLKPLILMADIIKFDFRQSSRDEIQAMIGTLRKEKPGLKFLAEKVETNEEFDLASALGCTYFQGYFFEKPRIISNACIPPAKMNLVRLMDQVSKEQIDFTKLSRLIRDDVAMSFKLLKFINSAYYLRPYPIDSIRDAISMLGEKDIRQFIMLIAATGLSEGKPEAIVKSSMVTACLCETIGTAMGSEFTGEELFTLGLFSYIDAILEMPMGEILKVLPFSGKISTALRGDNPNYSYLLGVVRGFERGVWETIFRCCRTFSIDEDLFRTGYARAVQMADAFFQEGPESGIKRKGAD